MQVSVIIPTYRRPNILRDCLRHLEQQTISSEIEVIVVSDGHDEETRSVCNSADWSIPVRYYEVEKSQQGTARNRGIKEARAPLCLFIGDDIFLDPNACEIHRDAHAQKRCAVLGFTTWDPAVGITPVMQWLEESGWQFGYPMIATYAGKDIPRDLQHRFTYTSHISISAEDAKALLFREDVLLYGWEDIEWGMRLRDAGLSLLYEPRASALHHHRMTLEESLKRMQTLGKSVVLLQQKVPALDRVPTGLKLLAYRLSALLPTMSGKHRRAFLQGIAES